MNPEISYLVVCFNSEKYISECLDSILRQSHTDYEIIVIDNASKDNTVSIVEDICTKNQRIKLISNLTNIGYGSAIAKTLENAKGEFLAILNADAYLDPRWASNLLKSFRSDEKIMSASGKIFFPNGELQSSGGMMDKYGAVIQRESKIFHSRKLHNKSNFFYNDGSSFMVRQKIFQEINFDQKLFLYYEDVDLSWKIRMLGYKVEYVTDAISYHHMGQSSSDMTLSKFYYMSKNRIYVCQKNYSRRNTISRVPIMLFLLFLNALYYDLSKKPRGYTKVFFKAMFWNLANMKFIIKEQKKLRLQNKISDNDLDRHLMDSSIELSFFK